MKKWLFLAIVMVPLVVNGTIFYIVETPVYEFDIRAGQQMACNGFAANDPCETMPYTSSLDVNSPMGVEWEYATDPNMELHWGFTWIPAELDVGTHDITITAKEDPNESYQPLRVNKIIRVTVHPQKKPWKISVGGCRIISVIPTAPPTRPR